MIDQKLCEAERVRGRVQRLKRRVALPRAIVSGVECDCCDGSLVSEIEVPDNEKELFAYVGVVGLRSFARQPRHQLGALLCSPFIDENGGLIQGLLEEPIVLVPPWCVAVEALNAVR